MITDVNSEDRLVQQTFAEHLREKVRWESVYAWDQETFGPAGLLGRASPRGVVLVRDLRVALARLNPEIPEAAREQAVEKLTRIDPSRSLLQHNREFYGYIQGRSAGRMARRLWGGPTRQGSGHRLSEPGQQPLPGRARAQDPGCPGPSLQPAG